MSIGQQCEDYLFQLAKITEGGPGLTRLYLTKEHKEAARLISKWMEDAGLKTEMDHVGNVIGSYDCGIADKPTLILGSHQDSVIHGGIYDGMLGIIAPILAIKQIGVENLHFNIKVAAFGDEEGVRFGTAYLGSKALTGSFTDELLQVKDESGLTLKEALIDFGLDPTKIHQAKLTDSVLDYLEVHIEQGPILEEKDQAVGIVNGINSFRRYEITITGHAGHAGNLPMHKRQDAGIAMAYTMTYMNELANETKDLVATIGKIKLTPDAINVVPGRAVFTLDIRAPEDNIINKAIEKIWHRLAQICTEHQCNFQYREISRSEGCACDKNMKEIIEKGMKGAGIDPVYLFSGAGHDAQEMKKIADIGMMFVRCKDGISHHPDEYVDVNDLEKAILVLMEILKQYNMKGM